MKMIILVTYVITSPKSCTAFVHKLSTLFTIIRMETEAEANNRRCFLGENGRPLRFCSRRIDTGGPVQYYRNQYFDFSSTDKSFSILSGSSVVALWTFNLNEAGSNLLFLPFCLLPN